MTEKTTTKWECDRCGRPLEMEASKQPSMWGYLLSATPPKANPSETTRRHLCPSCVDSLAKWLRNDKQPKKPRANSKTPTKPGYYLAPSGDLWTLHKSNHEWFNNADGSMAVRYATGEVEGLDFHNKPLIRLVRKSINSGRQTNG